VVSSSSEHYPLPYPGGTKLGKSIKLTLHPVRDRIPILLGAEGPKNVALATEIADGWLPIFYHVDRGAALYAEALSGAPEGFQVCCPVTVVVNDDVDAAREVVKWTLAFYIGGMGAANLNFHLNVIGRFGFADAAAEVQQHFLAGDREAAMRAVPDDLADGISLCGPLDRIRERLELWRASPVTTMLIGGVRDPAHLAALADMVR
jgi:alkanesulfonate monooxygenase SsuD/methylene tetrahydromethanopterin reductase-like flavin-dependent oxidoreductase (luciferase family)